ncbi:30S ribosomal protein S8 [Buchnera aphidicola (Schlechtendalia chinensis)]|uniref:Small ribosomal subunit protein uS8 n=1 Tax=Buchnera aphidicola subsp. Schlechtendalia chinensis TaxID=118110 RepID=A0A172WE23_BUCSC|nr:30S ribosomal protein S8 [Buchnera aphidicola]ANF17211.1 30S ribosomal protein S8 [Buchnera aphidicola (Schlechtendalia chinensis)]
MTIQDPISDMLTRIRNSQSANKMSVVMPSSKLKVAISKVLKQEGYIKDYILKSCAFKPDLELILKYFNGKPVIEYVFRVSSPSLRVYNKKHKLSQVMAGLGIAIISTSRGVMTDKSARQAGLGGEIICHVA